MNHYKSWSALNRQLSALLCDDLQGRITYFLTRYAAVHDSYGCAAIRLDGRELVRFTWANNIRQEWEYNLCSNSGMEAPFAEMLKARWDANCILSEGDFLHAALRFRDMPIRDALNSEDWIVRVFAIMDRRVGRRTLNKIALEGIPDGCPAWARQFYELRLSA